MTPVAILLVLFVVALMLFATEWLPVDVTALLLLGALLLFGLLTPKEAFAGFGSDTVLTLASLFVLTRVLLLPVGRVVAHVEGRNAFYPAPIPREWKQMMLAFSRRREQVHALAWENRTIGRELAALAPHYPELRVPVTLLAGPHDRLAPYAEHAAPLRERLPGLRLWTVEGGGHQLHWTHPDEVAAATLQALTALPGSGPPGA